MGPVKAVFDTNILVDYLNGHVKAAEELRRFSELVISRITWIEVLAGASLEDEDETRRFLRLFRIEELTADIAETALEIRRERKPRLPDAIILATAQRLGCLLVTRNTKDFDSRSPEIRVPYRM